jgi:pilus assembly protein CpaC
VHHDESETELLMMVTPELASPVDPSCLPDGPGRNTVVPTDRELYFNGYLETPRYAPDPEPDVSGYSSGAYVPPPAQFAPSMGPTPAGIPPEPAYEAPNGNGPRPGLPVPENLPPAEPSAGAEVTQISGIAPARRGATPTRASTTSRESRTTKRKNSSKGAEKPTAAPSKWSGTRQEERPGLIAP